MTPRTALRPPSSERAGARNWRASRKRRAVSAVTFTPRTLLLTWSSKNQPWPQLRRARSSLLLEIVADHVEEALPPRALSLDPLGRVGKRFRSQPQPVGSALDHARDDTGLFEQPEMARDRRLGDAEAAARLADRRRAGAQSLHDFASDRVCERGERIVSHRANYRVPRDRSERRLPMLDHAVGTREEWLAARTELLAAEKEHSRRGDALAARRRELP